MSKLIVAGGARLSGRLRINGAKNAVLPILAAALLSEKPVTLLDCPRLLDVDNMLAILSELGVRTKFENSTVWLDPSGACGHVMPAYLSGKLRSSIFMLGPLLARFRKANCTFPGGCEIGHRPIDLHLKGLEALNVRVAEEQGSIICDGSDMRGALVHLDYPSVGATENLMMAAVAARGRTIISNAAREPEIADLQLFLNELGFDVSGAGSTAITIEGGGRARETEHRIMPDRIVAGTMMCAAAMTGGSVELANVRPDDVASVSAKLAEAGCEISAGNDTLGIRAPKRPREIRIVETGPHPGFPTDMQAQMMAVAAVASGTSVIVENVFENRFKHAYELMRMGANVTIKDRTAVIRGVKTLKGANVCARDLRAGAALCIAGLRAEGRTVVEGVSLIDRGYERIEDMLCALGADVTRSRDED